VALRPHADTFQRVSTNLLSAFQRLGRYEPAVLAHLDLVRRGAWEQSQSSLYAEPYYSAGWGLWMQALLVAPTRHLHATRLQLLARFMLHDPLNYDEYYKRARADMAVLRDVLRRANTSNPATFSHIAVRARRLCSAGAALLTAHAVVRAVCPSRLRTRTCCRG